MERSRLLVTVRAEHGLRQATVSLIMTLGRRNTMEPPIISALISASVSLFVVVISRWVFSRTDRRFPILVQIQDQLLKLQKDPPWSTNGGNVYFEKVRETAATIDPYFDRLRMVSFPVYECAAQKAWKRFRYIDEEKWKKAHPNRSANYDSLTKEEYLAELKQVLDSLK